MPAAISLNMEKTWYGGATRDNYWHHNGYLNKLVLRSYARAVLFQGQLLIESVKKTELIQCPM